MSFRKLIVLVLVLGFFGTIFGAEFDVDYATFYGDENISVVEIYLHMPRDLFEFIKVENQFQSDIFIRTALTQKDSVVQLDQWNIVDKLADKSMNIKGQKIPEISTLQVKPGNYKLIVFVADMNTKEKYKYEKEIVVYDYHSDQLMISDVLLASQMGKTQTKNKFSKYFGYDMLPNASLIFGDNSLKIFPFCEIYNLSYNKDKKGSYQIEYMVTDINEKEILSDGFKEKEKPGKTAVEVTVAGVDLSKLSSGLYNLKITVKDVETGQIAEKIKRFYMLRQKDEDLLSEIVSEQSLNSLSEKELNEKFGPMSYIATNNEKRQFKKSDINGKRKIISHFWDNRDPDPSTELNEAKVNFKRLVSQSEQKFTSGFRKGWKSDKGRVLIKYGHPDDIEMFPSSIESKPYDIWYYHNIEGGVEFVFIDKSGFGSMELVHSTVRNELQDPDWRRFCNQ